MLEKCSMGERINNKLDFGESLCFPIAIGSVFVAVLNFHCAKMLFSNLFLPHILKDVNC